MDRSALFLIVFIAMVAALAGLIAFWPELTRARGGKILAFVAFCILPALAVWVGGNEHLERSTSTKFCLSCHVMADYGKSLYLDDKSYIPAVHFQNNLVPRDQACFTCHTDYTMFGDYKAKWRGLHHVEVEYFGRIPKAADIKLYTPYNNRECLHCHSGMRAYEEAPGHHKNPKLLELAASNQVSCMSSDCHDIVHEVGNWGDASFWKPQQETK